jgi:hypothetical protein
MAQDLMNKHWVAEISRVSAVYGTGHILSGEMDKDRDNGEIVAVGAYKEGEYYTVSDFAGEFEAKVIEIVPVTGRTMVRIELTKDCDGYFVHNPETMPNDFLKVYQDVANYYNAKGDRVRMYPMYKHDVFTLSSDAFVGEVAIGKTVTYADGYTVA